MWRISSQWVLLKLVCRLRGVAACDNLSSCRLFVGWTVCCRLSRGVLQRACCAHIMPACVPVRAAVAGHAHSTAAACRHLRNCMVCQLKCCSCSSGNRPGPGCMQIVVGWWHASQRQSCLQFVHQSGASRQAQFDTLPICTCSHAAEAEPTCPLSVPA